MNRELVIDSTHINDDSDCYVIAEIGHNHQGSLEKAKEIFLRAKECGVNAVKLQKRDNRSLYTREMYHAPYDTENSFGPTYGAHREALELGWHEYVELKRYTAELGLMMFATAFDFKSANFLAELEMPAFKIASGDLKNIPLLKHVAQFGKPMLVSTGGSAMKDVQRAYDAIMPINTQLCLMQCTASYPAEPENMNLRVIETYREKFPEVVTGLSDHQNGIAMALVAYMLGARVIEKHFTLNRAWKGTDHAFSLEPIGMRKLVRDLRRAHVALGSGIKQPLPCETKPLYKMGKKLVAAHGLPAGHVLRHEDIAIKSPNDGLPPYELENVLGKVTIRALKEDENISFEDLRHNNDRRHSKFR
jgi:N-acetylneuraminate synthase/sialic acid synthase